MVEIDTTAKPSPWWTPGRHADRKPFLMARGAITRAIRAWFDEQGFSEVETGILQVSPGNEIHLHAPRTEVARADGSRASRYLRTSPEFACKKLLKPLAHSWRRGVGISFTNPFVAAKITATWSSIACGWYCGCLSNSVSFSPRIS